MQCSLDVCQRSCLRKYSLIAMTRQTSMGVSLAADLFAYVCILMSAACMIVSLIEYYIPRRGSSGLPVVQPVRYIPILSESLARIGLQPVYRHCSVRFPAHRHCRLLHADRLLDITESASATTTQWSDKDAAFFYRH